jgi:hypothetical protein
VVQSARGAVAGPESARGAFVTMTEGTKDPHGYSWWAAWDRFAVADLVRRAAGGELCAPPMAGLLRRTLTQLKASK